MAIKKTGAMGGGLSKCVGGKNTVILYGADSCPSLSPQLGSGDITEVRGRGLISWAIHQNLHSYLLGMFAHIHT